MECFENIQEQMGNANRENRTSKKVSEIYTRYKFHCNRMKDNSRISLVACT
jgi:hypothetical protein